MMETNEVPFKITPQYVLDLILRRRWAILTPICFSLIVGITLLFVLPKIYKAKTLIIIESQRVPQNYVRSIITEDTAQRIATISQQILSTSNLEKIIKDFDLFSEPEYRKLYLEDKVAIMLRTDAAVIPARTGLSSLKGSYASCSPMTPRLSSRRIARTATVSAICLTSSSAGGGVSRKNGSFVSSVNAYTPSRTRQW